MSAGSLSRYPTWVVACPTVHPLVTQFRAVGVSRPVDLTDLGDRAFALGVIDGWAAQVGEDDDPVPLSHVKQKRVDFNGAADLRAQPSPWASAAFNLHGISPLTDLRFSCS